MWRKRNSPIYDLAVFFRVAYCVSLSSHRSIEAKLQKLKCLYRSTATRNPFSPKRKCRGVISHRRHDAHARVRRHSTAGDNSRLGNRAAASGGSHSLAQSHNRAGSRSRGRNRRRLRQRAAHTKQPSIVSYRGFLSLSREGFTIRPLP